MTSVSYAQLQSALANNANAIGDTAAAASLAATSPVNGQYWIPTAEAQALGLAGARQHRWLCRFHQRSIPSTITSAIPAAQYRITVRFLWRGRPRVFRDHGPADVGRRTDFASAARLYRARSVPLFGTGRPDFSGTTPGYFSPNGGFTNLGNFNTDPYGDFGDWAGSVGNDAYLAYTNPGALNPVTSSDLTVMNLLGWDFNAAIGSAGDYCCACPGS